MFPNYVISHLKVQIQEKMTNFFKRSSFFLGSVRVDENLQNYGHLFGGDVGAPILEEY